MARLVVHPAPFFSPASTAGGSRVGEHRPPSALSSTSTTTIVALPTRFWYRRRIAVPTLVIAVGDGFDPIRGDSPDRSPLSVECETDAGLPQRPGHHVGDAARSNIHIPAKT